MPSNKFKNYTNYWGRRVIQFDNNIWGLKRVQGPPSLVWRGMEYVNVSLKEKKIVYMFCWDHHTVLIATQENQSVFVPTRIFWRDARQQAAVNKSLCLNPNLLQACHFLKPRRTWLYRDPLFFIIKIIPIMFPSLLLSEVVFFSCSPSGKNVTFKVLCGNPTNCALVDKDLNTAHFQGLTRKCSLLWL